MEVHEESVVEFLPDPLRPRERLLVPETEGQAEPLVPEAGAPVHVRAQLVREHAVRGGPVPLLHDHLHGLRVRPLLHEDRREE